MTENIINVQDIVRVGLKGKADYRVISINDQQIAKLESVERGTKRSAYIFDLVSVKRFEPETPKPEAQEVKVSWVKRATQRIKGKRGGKLRNL